MSECYTDPQMLGIKKKLDVLYVISQYKHEYSLPYKILKRAYDDELKHKKHSYINGKIRNSNRKVKHLS